MLPARLGVISVKNTKSIEEIFNDHHIVEDGDAFEKGYSLKCECKTELVREVRG